MKYSLLIFDADDTLFDYPKGERFALSSSFERFNVPYDEKFHLPLYKKYNSEVWKKFEIGGITPDELKIERFKNLFDHLKFDLDPQEFSDEYLTRLSEATFLLPGAFELLKSVSPGRKIVLLTNGLTKVQRPRFRNSAIYKFIDEVIISEEVGIQKPDPAIFTLALEDAGHKDKSSVLMIGDNLKSDILGGINSGIDTCWFNPGRLASDERIVPTFEIENLQDLIKIL